MSYEEPPMPDEEPTSTHEPRTVEPELPPRPRHRLTGSGASPIPLALIGVLLTACGFIGGALVEKGQSSPANAFSSASALASRFGALRAGGGAGGGVSFARASAGGSAGGAGAGSFGATSGSTTVGEVAYVSGHTLYVTEPEGNTVEVKTTSTSTVTKTVKTDVKGIHPGETVIVRGRSGHGGAIGAESVRVGEVGGGGLGTLFAGGGGLTGSGRGGGARAGGASSEGGSASSGEGPVLFGK
jgi:hypothetical protein